MLSDRYYMRENEGRPAMSALAWVICAIAAGFVVESIALHWFPGSAFAETLFKALALSPATFREGFVWTLFSYGVLHDPTQFLHILTNLLGIYFLGRELIPALGGQRFVGLCLSAVILGGLTWLGCNWFSGGQLIGASAIVCGLLVVFACLNPNQSITLLLFFFIPVSLKPKYLAWGLLAFDLFGLLFLELPHHSSLGIAHSAHLGGMLAGWLYFRHLHEREWPFNTQRAAIELPRWFRKARKTEATAAPAFKVNLTSRESLRAEVDRILDKINSQGFGALTAEEKHLLDEAKDLLSRR